MLDPLPIDFDEAAHSYVWAPSGEKLAYSVTQVCSFDKTPAQLANIEKYREGPTGWEARGVAVHAALEAFLKKEEPKFPLDSAIFAEWVAPLLAHSFWNDFEPLLIEGRLCDLKKSVGGSCDALGIWRGKTVLPRHVPSASQLPPTDFLRSHRRPSISNGSKSSQKE